MRSVPQRFAQLVLRDLGATEVGIRDLAEAAPDPDAPPPSVLDAVDEARTIAVAIGAGREMVAVFSDVVVDRDASTRRLEMLIDSFRDMLDAADDEERSRPAPERILHAELRALVADAAAIDAAVIDAQSPVVWGDASSESSEPQVVDDLDNVIAMPGVVVDRPGESWRPGSGLREVVEAVRALPQLAALPRSGVLHHHGEHAGKRYVLRSFATIYVLVVVFDGAPDDLRAERAIGVYLPRIERAVLALPPLDPEPADGAGAMRRR